MASVSFLGGVMYAFVFSIAFVQLVGLSGAAGFCCVMSGNCVSANNRAGATRRRCRLIRGRSDMW